MYHHRIVGYLPAADGLNSFRFRPGDGLPAITWFEGKLPRPGSKPRLKRAFSIFLVFTVILGFIGVFSYFIVTAIIDSSVILLEGAPFFIGKNTP